MRGLRPRVVVGVVAGLVLAGLSPAPTGQAAPAGEGAAAAASEARPARYVAMGDSYSSGEGTFVYLEGTDTTVNRCHRSPLAYGPLLSYRKARLRPLEFVACSGAVTADLYAPREEFSSEGPQLDALAPTTRTVSLTIGGNDLGFDEVASACVQTTPSTPPTGFRCSQNPALIGVVAARLAALAGEGTAPAADGSVITAIEQVLTDIHQRAPRARIYLAGYPKLFGTARRGFRVDETAPSDRSCVLNPVLDARVDYADAQWVNATARDLNRVLRSAVRRVRADGVRATYVSPSTFTRHGLCDRARAWIQPVLVVDPRTRNPLPESLHPTPTGHARGYARAFRRAGL